MSQKNSSRIWIIAGTSCLLIAGVLLVLVSLGNKPVPLAQATIPAVSPTPLPPTKTPTLEPSPTPTEEVVDDPVVASVNGKPIKYSLWLETVLLDQVASGLAGWSAPRQDDVLQRMISEELMLQAVPSEQTPTTEEVEARIAMLEQAWGVDDAAMVAALEAVELDRATFEQAIQRVLVVKAAMATLEGQGHNLAEWLQEQRDSADILIFEDVAVLDIADAQAAIATQVALPPPPTPTEVPLSALALGVAEKAPDFTLERTGGGTFTLAEQLAQGPVVMVFFQKCG